MFSAVYKSQRHFNQIWMNATWFACLQRFKIQAAVMNMAVLKLWLHESECGYPVCTEMENKCSVWEGIFWKLICVCFHTLWAACRHEWCLRRDGGSDSLTAPGAPSAWGRGGLNYTSKYEKCSHSILARGNAPNHAPPRQKRLSQTRWKDLLVN